MISEREKYGLHFFWGGLWHSLYYIAKRSAFVIHFHIQNVAERLLSLHEFLFLHAATFLLGMFKMGF